MAEKKMSNVRIVSDGLGSKTKVFVGNTELMGVSTIAFGDVSFDSINEATIDIIGCNIDYTVHTEGAE